MHTSERLYYSDSFLQTFEGAVTDISETVGDGETRWRLSFDRTAFYPTSGGQPFDTGNVMAILQDGTVQRVPIEHVDEDEEGEVWHYARQPIAAGTRFVGNIDWERRFDHMQQHTGQHLLSAMIWREIQIPTISFHLGEYTSTIDVASGALTYQALEIVERIANEIVGEDRAVTSRLVPRAEAEAMLASGKLRKLPERQGAIRLIDIANCDDNACGGTHVRSTGQIGGLQIRTIEKMSRGMRIEFVCGLRAVRAARADRAILRETSALLSTGTAEVVPAVKRLVTEGKANAKERLNLREELALFEAARLAAEEPIHNGLRLLLRSWRNRDRDYVKLLASKTAASQPGTAVIFSASGAGLVHVVVARSPDLDLNCGCILREALAQFGLRGGGSPDLAQGEIPANQELALRALLSDSIRKSVKANYQS